MSKPVSTSTDLPVDAAAAFAAMTAPDWYARLAAHGGDGTEHVSTTPAADGGAVVVAKRPVPDAIPAALAKLVPKGTRATQTDTWGPAQPDGGRRGTWTVTSPGLPVQLGGDVRLEPAGDGRCRFVVDGAVSVKIPVVGGRLEGPLADLTRTQATAEGAAMQAVLAP